VEVCNKCLGYIKVVASSSPASSEELAVPDRSTIYLNGELVRYLASGKEGYDVVIPETGRGPEPLHAVYGKGALGAIDEALKTGDRKVVSFFGKVKVRKVAEPEVERFDPSLRSFRNINTPEDYFHFRESEKDGLLSNAGTPEDHERAGR